MTMANSKWSANKFDAVTHCCNIVFVIVATILFNAFCYGQPNKDQLSKFDLNALTLSYSKNYFSSIFDKKISDSVQIVGLGEVSHGGYEPLAFKVNMVKYLIENKGYRKILFEFSDIGDIRAMRNYLTHKNGNDTSYINRWVINGAFMNAFAAVFPDLLKWIKLYNDKHPKDMVQIMGFDIRNEQLDINFVLNKYIIPYNSQRSQQYVYQLTSSTSDPDKISLIGKWFKSNETDLKTKLNKEDFYWLSFYVNNVTNGLNYVIKNSKTKTDKSDSTNLFRDSVMSENVKYLSGKEKSIIWAHNGHVVRFERRYMGNYLNQYFKNKYYVIATDFSKYAAVEVTNPDSVKDLVDKKHPSKIFKSAPSTAAYNILDKYGVSEGIYFRQDLIRMNIKEDINVIDVAGVPIYIPEFNNPADALVIFSTIYPDAK